MNVDRKRDREIVLDRLRQDLIGPDSADEVVGDRPSDLYLTGILWPPTARMSGEELEHLGAGGDEGGEAGEDEEVPLAGAMRPSTAGLSFAIAGDEVSIDIVVEGACYKPEDGDDRKTVWHRYPFAASLAAIDCDADAPFKVEIACPLDGVYLDIRSASWSKMRARLVTVTLVNGATPSENGRQAIEAATLFQVSMKVHPGKGCSLIPRPDRRAVIDDDDRSAALLYRDAVQFAAGHTCSAAWSDPVDGAVAWVVSEWIPSVEVPATNADGDAAFDALREGELRTLDADWLAEASDEELGRALVRLPEAYRKWISRTATQVSGLPDDQRATAEEHLKNCDGVASRLETGAGRISKEPRLASAFRLANRAMVLQRQWSDGSKLAWRPFQLAFLLLTSVSAVDRRDECRRTMDLLWFPTGGGKTEAYLGLIAFLAMARRTLGGSGAGGVAAIMRYTLRLLTTQQFERATSMILACEAIRRGRVAVKDDISMLGATPFGIGLWVGGDATPNDVATAARALNHGEDDGPTPRQLLACPACKHDLDWTPRVANGNPVSIEVRCLNTQCVLHSRDSCLPIYTVDEDIYVARPTLLLGTVDKFAQIVRNPIAGALFDAGGAPPDLIIQDELHLISGPLGSMVGLYEAGIDRLFWRDDQPPKVIGSTATIRRAEEQVKALFDRDVCQFPPPGISHDDSGFAVAEDVTRRPGRLYVAVSTAGRSAKFTLQAVSASLLQTGNAAFDDDNRRDPYWTLLAYFNSLRELGGALVLMQDDVPDAIRLYSRRRRESRKERKTLDVQELTSRRTQKEVRNMLQDMAITSDRDGALDVVLASNMVSVGVDIPRLGLMLVNGQPKGVAEYIQATSRVGRRHPGIVVCLLNNGKARDRSHFETFRTWHATLYRDVEASSVTPFASRARDRALHAALVAAARHLVPGLDRSPRLDINQIALIERLIVDIAMRAREIDQSETAVRVELERFFQLWKTRGSVSWWEDRNPNRSLLISAEAAATLRAQGLDARGAVPTPNSMRNVEAGVPFRLVTGLRAAGEKND